MGDETSQIAFLITGVVLFLAYCFWLGLMITHPVDSDPQTLDDRAPYWCDFRGMRFHRVGSDALVAPPNRYQCIDEHGEVHTYVEG